MVISALFFASFFYLLQDSIPFKKDNEFECKLNLTFRARADNGPTVDFTETVIERQKRLSNTPLPYLKINVTFFTLSEDEQRVQIIANGEYLRSKKVRVGEPIELDLGYTDDIKDRITPHEYTLVLLSKDKKSISKITLSFTEEGDYLVNSVKRGRI
jgi:hypothetical protein